MSGFLFEATLDLSKRCRPGMQDVTFGRYRLQPLPTADVESGSALFSFLDEGPPGEATNSHPEEEAGMAIAVLSLLTNTRTREHGVRLNHIDLPRLQTQKQLYPEAFGEMETEELDLAFRSLVSLSDGLCRQFVRGARTYSLAMDFVVDEPALAFFLLVVSVECLSTQDSVIRHADLNPDTSCERYCRFVRDNLRDADKGQDERDEQLFTKLLKRVYHSHRSGYAHGGKEVAVATAMADRAGSSYFRSIIDGKEILTPGIRWFARIVRSALIGYLLDEKTESPDSYRLWRLARERSAFTAKFRRPVQAHQMVTLDDIEYR